MKITQIKVEAGRDVILLESKSASWVISGKSGTLPDKLAAKLWKTIAGSAEKYFDILKDAKPGDFKG